MKEKPEIFFGFVGAVGTSLNVLIEQLKDILEVTDYNVSTFKLSKLIREYGTLLPNKLVLKEKPEDDRIHSYMDAGNKYRRYFQRGDAVAILAIQKRLFELTGKLPTNNAYILDSLKHPDEVNTLRRVYGSGFYLIGVHSSHEERKKELAKAIMESHNENNSSKFYPDVETLMLRDETESDKFGQKVSNTFHMADVFISIDNKQEAKSDLNRFIEIVFGNPFYTPRKDEHAMYLAHASSLRSGDLPRQVGASIATEHGEVISMGANDVPSPEGGLYWSDSKDDKRDWILGYDSNKKQIEILRNNIFETLKNDDNLKNTDRKKITDCLKNSIISNLTEYGRSVHAEMDAITQASRLGIPLDGTTLFTTLFPCHNCTKHIIASGIKRVVYIEPYSKSLAPALHDDAIIIDQMHDKKISFEPFVGIGPRRYFDLFSLKTSTGFVLERKDDNGKIINWNIKHSIPRLPIYPISYLDQEKRELKKMLKKK